MSSPARTYRQDLHTYAIGLVLALLLTGLAFGAVLWQLASPLMLLTIVFGLGLLQMVVHFRFFLHVDLGESARDNLQLVLFSVLIILIMVGGTLVILLNLHQRMMM